MPNYRSMRAIAWIIALALALAAWIVRDLPVENIVSTIANLTVTQWFYWLIINLSIILILVWRWLVLTKGFKLRVNLFDLLLLRQAGQTISFITPGPQFGGEPLQIFLLWKKYSIAPGDSFLAVAADRVFELWTNFAVLLIGIMIVLFTRADLANWIYIATLIISLLIFFSLSIWLLINRSEKIEASINKLAHQWLDSKRLTEINFQSPNFTTSLRILLNNKTSLISAFLLSLVGWIVTFFELYLVLSFFNISLDISQFVLLLVAMRLAFLLPLPGGLGTLEAAVIWSFTALSLPISSAAALLALIRFRDVVVLGLGFICLRLLQSKTVTV